jgi:hypothetical protein
LSPFKFIPIFYVEYIKGASNMDERDKLRFELEQTQERLVKENQKTMVVLTIYAIIVYGAIVYIKCPGDILDMIIESVIMGIVIMVGGIGVWSYYTGLYTNIEGLKRKVYELKFKVEEIEKKDREYLQ